MLLSNSPVFDVLSSDFSPVLDTFGCFECVALFWKHLGFLGVPPCFGYIVCFGCVALFWIHWMFWVFSPFGYIGCFGCVILFWIHWIFWVCNPVLDIKGF